VLDEVLGPGGFCEQDVLVRCGDESILAPVLREVAAAYPDVYIKSRASGFELDQRFRVSLHAVGTDNQQASRAVRAALSGLMLEFEKRGVEASPIS
jgi:molybdopterin-biosynthesis enzyme MoeA-like protein